MARRLIALAIGAALAAAPAAAADFSSTASYVINLGGINIANADVVLAETGGRYAMDMEADVSGLGQLVASGTARAGSKGAVTASALQPQDFSLTTRTAEGTFEAKASFAKGDVSAFTVTPPLLNNIDRVAIERAHLTRVTDMMAAFVLKGGTLDASLCEHKARVFTGLERFDLSMRFAKGDTATSARTGYQGPVVLCNVKYTPVSGHFTTSAMTQYLTQSDRILIWYAPLRDTGYFIPYRALLATGAGDLSIVLTALK